MAKTFPATRVSTLAKTLDDKGGLMDYHAATALQIIAKDKTLRDELALVRPKDALDWRAYKPLVNKAHAMRGKPEADAGTNIHAVVEMIIAGESVEFVDPVTVADAREVLHLLTALGLTPAFTEQFVYLGGLPEPVAGTRDIACKPSRSGPLVSVDIKSTSEFSPDAMKYSGTAWAMQLACYANGQPYPTEDLQRDQWGRPKIDPDLIGTLPAQEMNVTVGVVIEVQRGAAQARPHFLDLKAGLRLAELSCHVRAARREIPIYQIPATTR